MTPLLVAANLEGVAFSLMGMSLFLRTSMPSPRGKVHDPEDMAENLRCMAHERWDMASPSKGSTPSGLGTAATDSTLAPSFGELLAISLQQDARDQQDGVEHRFQGAMDMRFSANEPALNDDDMSLHTDRRRVGVAPRPG